MMMIFGDVTPHFVLVFWHLDRDTKPSFCPKIGHFRAELERIYMEISWWCVVRTYAVVGFDFEVSCCWGNLASRGIIPVHHEGQELEYSHGHDGQVLRISVITQQSLKSDVFPHFQQKN